MTIEVKMFLVNVFFALVLVLSISVNQAFHLSVNPSHSLSGSFPSTLRVQARGVKLVMGNNAKFGIFSPVVYAAKFALGDAKLNKVSYFAIFNVFFCPTNCWTSILLSQCS